ncbi:cyclase [Oceanobacillus arenosus]|uniref:Cyclase n=1 Tax=Oceanobacillus arenosus TaxID=1229153 RepID=A0A3D8PQS7_9BACI|nr:cyclase family protein [Oceanobacillus arenosus]RDW17529.1 cyclase [Oceanobacillus arenosus]
MIIKESNLISHLEVIKKGEVIELGHPFQPGIPHHPFHPPFLYSMGRMHNDLSFEGGVSSANDFIATGTHTGTHMDALGHISCDGLLHENISVDETQDKNKGLSELSIDKAPPVIKRAIVLDIPLIKKRDVLDHAYGITKEDLIEATRRQYVTIKDGDAVFIRTGWAKYYNDPKLYISHEKGVPGVTLEGAKWLVAQGAVLTGSDTVAYEKTPSPKMAVHRYLLVERGIHIIEALNLEELSKNSIYEFLFIALPLKIKGGTGSPISPIAVI